MTVPTADLSDAGGGRLLPLSLPWRSFGAVRAFSGRVVTVRCRDDNGLVRSVLDGPGHARVLLVDGGGSVATALVGDGLGGLALAHGWAGIVVHGAVRDVAALAALDLGVLALATNPRRGVPGGVGEVDVPVLVAGVLCQPGCELFADEDGVLVEADSSASA